MSTQLQLYSRQPVPRDLHFIRLVNPRFNNTSRINGDWENPSGEWVWLGQGYADFAYANQGSKLYQVFPNPPLENTHYRIHIEVTDLTVGSIDLFMGRTFIANIDNNDAHSILWHSSSGSTMAGSITFIPKNDGSGYFDGRIQSVQIVQYPAYMAQQDFTYEPSSTLDLDDGERLGITLRVNDLKSIDKRFGVFSKTFTVPGGKNTIALGHLQSTSVKPREDGFNPRKRTKADLLHNENKVLSGFLSLKAINVKMDKSTFDFDLTGSDSGLLQDIKGKRLSDLDLSAWGHRLTLDSIIGTWTTGRTWSDAYYYPIYPVFGSDHRVNDHFRPAYYQRAVIDRIIRSAGYDYSLSADLEALSSRLIHCPLGKKPAALQEDLDLEAAKAGSNVSQALLSTASASATEGSVDWQFNRAVWNANVEMEDPGGNYDASTGTFTAPYTGEYTIEMQIDASLVIDTGLYSVERFAPRTEYPHVVFGVVDVETDNGLVWTDQREFPSELFAAHNETRHFSAKTSTVQLNAGQRIRLKLFINNSTIYKTQSGPTVFIRPGVSLTVQDANSFWSVRPTAGSYPVSEGMAVRAEDFLGTASQEHVLQDFLRMHNAFVVPDASNPKLLHIKSRSALYDTEKVLHRTIDLDAGYKKKILAEVSSSQVNLAYRKASDKDTFVQHYQDLTGKEYGIHEFAFPTDCYNSTSEIRLNQYTAAPITRDDSGRWLPAVEMNAADQQAKILAVSTAATPTQLRIQFFDQVSRTMSSYTHSEYFSTLHTSDLVDPTFDLCFGEIDRTLSNEGLELSSNNLFNANYRDQLQQYANSELYEVWMPLSIADVQEHIDHVGARIYVKSLDRYFTLVAIVDWDPTLAHRTRTKVELMECGPSERRINSPFNYTTRGTTGALNPVTGGRVPSSVLGGTGSSTDPGPWNTGTGNNTVGTGTQHNDTRGSGNTIYGTFTTIVGNDNKVPAGVSGVTIFGSNVTATTSNSFFFGPNYTFTNSGATYFSSTTIGPTFTSFYGPSGVTINHGSINIGGSTGLTFTTTGVTVNGETIDFEDTKVQGGINTYTGGTPSRPTVNVVASPVFSSITATTIFSGSVNLSRYLTGSTFSLPSGLAGYLLQNVSGGTTYAARELGIAAASDGSYWFRYAHPFNTITLTGGGGIGNTIVGGFANTLSGSNVVNTHLVGASSSTLIADAGSQSSIILGGVSHNLRYASHSSILAGNQNSISGGTGAFTVAGTQNTANASLHSGIVGGQLHTIRSTFLSGLLAGERNVIVSGQSNAIVGGSYNGLTGCTGSAIVAGSGITASGRTYTLFTNAIEIQQVLDLKPLTGASPDQRDGRLFFSGSSLYLGSGGVWREVALV